MTLSRIVIYGGKGALGAACVSHFKLKNWWVASIDMKENEEADFSLVVNQEDSWQDQEIKILKNIDDYLKGDKVDAVICVAGGWAGGNAASKDFVKTCDLMWRQSVWSSVIAASIAVHHLKEDGLLSLTGAKPSLSSTPGMIGYGMAKAAVHHLTKSLSGENSGLPPNSVTLSILPITLDTPMNRKWMGDADKSTWTPLEFVSDLFFRWSLGQDRPPNGSLVQLVTKNNQTDLCYD